MLKLKKKQAKPAQPASRPASAAHSPQGITAKGNALRRIILIALLIILAAIALGFTLLLLFREPVIPDTQIDRVASSYAAQHATNVQRLVSQLRERVISAAKSPLAMSAIASDSGQDISLVEQAMLDYFPEVMSLRIIPISDMGTADLSNGNHGLRNHIEVDLVRGASEDEEVKPESYQFEKQWMTSIAAKVIHPRIPDRSAVIILTLDNKLLADQLATLEADAGRSEITQTYTGPNGRTNTETIAHKGNGEAGEYTRYAEVPDSTWQVSFSPSSALVDALRPSTAPLYMLAGLILASALCAAIVISRMYTRALSSEVNRIVSAADRRTPLELQIPELTSIAKQLRRATLRALRQSGNASAGLPLAEVEAYDEQGDDYADPLFQSKSVVDHEEGSLDLNLDLAEPGAPDRPEPEPGFPSHIFRAYDIRGNAQSELSDELVIRIGKAIGSIAGERGEQTLIVASDGRASSSRIRTALIRALMETGRDVVDIGLVPTPLLYFATRHLSYRSGVMITGSHNPADDNGFKIVLNQQTIAAGGIQEVCDRVITGSFSKGNGRMVREDVVPAYIDAVLHDIAIAVPLKIVIDAGNGATSDIAPQLFEELGCEVIPLYCRIDGAFPNHPPDTSNEANLTDLIRTVKEKGADFGVAFDGDGDRLAVVTSSGQIVRTDVLMMLYAQDVVSRNPGADVVFDVKCSRNLTNLITRHGGRPVLWKTGHAFMKEKIRETGALLGGEFSGHIFFGERWYGFDDGMYAAGRLAEILSTHGQTLDDAIDQFPSTINTPEILIPVADSEKFQLMRKIVTDCDFSGGKVNTLDGIRVDFSNGWGLVRASNTVPALTARFEADTHEDLEQIQDEFRAQIALIDPSLKLGF